MSSFTITAPFSDVPQVGELRKAGAGELYCGFIDAEGERSWPASFYLLNRRAKGGNFEDPGRLREALAEAHACGLPVYVTLNGMYTEEQYPWLLRTVETVSALKGFTGLIVADIALLATLGRMRYGGKICISTGGTVFNTRALEFFRSFNARRVILDRQLTGEELADIAARRERPMELEIFAFHSGCLFIDGYCAMFHCQDEGESVALDAQTRLVRRQYALSGHYGGCQKIHEVLQGKTYEVFDRAKKKKVRNALSYVKDRYPSGCNLCSLFSLKDAGGISLKVVGRGEKRFSTVRGVADAVRLLGTGITRARYTAEAKKIYRALTKETCNGFRCYCPPQLVGKGGR